VCLALFCAAVIMAFPAALAQPGAIDPGFVNSLTGVESISDLAFQLDGKIVFAGSYVGDGASRACVGRIHPDGQADSTFAMGLGPAGSTANAILLEPDGKILVGGYFDKFNEVPCQSLIRLKPDGSVDSTFNQIPAIENPVTDLIRDGEGRVLVVEYFARGVLWSTDLTRLNADGTVDTTFAGPTFEWTNAKVVLQPDGKILAAHENLAVGGQGVTITARLNPDGSLDETFESGLSPIGPRRVDVLALQPDGRILVGGRFSRGRTLVMRLHADGALDPTFSLPLDLEYKEVPGFVSGGVNSIATQPDGKIVVSGAFRTINGFAAPYLARLNPDGTLDANFDPGTGPDQIPTRVILDPLGNLFVVGSFTQYNGTPANACFRVFTGEPAPMAPVFKEQPIALVLDAGQTVKLACLVSAFPLPSYQWERDGVEIPGATHSELVLTTNLMAGTYRLRASNSLGSVISDPVEPTVPSILTQPVSQSVRQGENAAFTVLATNFLSLSYQWQFEGVDVPGATNATLALTNVQPSQAGAYTVIVSNALGLAATSEAAILTVLPHIPPEILAQPQSQSVEAGMEVRFSVVATNYLPLTYQWQFNSVEMVGATQANLTLPSVRLSDQGEYRVIVRSEYVTTSSAAALLEVKPVEFVPGPGVVTNATQADLEVAMSSGLPVTFGVNGTIPLTNTFVIAHDTTLDGTGRSIKLDGQGAIRHFVVTNGATLRLINLTLANGRYAAPDGETHQPGSPGWGGSIYNAVGKLELLACHFLSNQVNGGRGGPGGRSPSGGRGLGGAIGSHDGEVWAENCTFTGNTCVGGAQGPGEFDIWWEVPGEGYGGALYSSNGLVNLTGVAFTNNIVIENSSSYGGAVAQTDGTLLVKGCTFVSNKVTGGSLRGGAGGAISSSPGTTNATVKIEQSTFRLNQANGGRGDREPGGSGVGGAIYVREGTLEMDGCALILNEANGGSGWYGNDGGGLGGGIYFVPSLTGVCKLTNCTLAQNRARSESGISWGGGLYHKATTTNEVLLFNVTFAQNSASGGKDGFDGSDPGSGSSIFGLTTLANTILSCELGQTNVGCPIHLAPWNPVDLGNNLCSDDSASFTSPSSRVNLDPQLAPLADNGGPTPTMALLPGSPAIDAGGDPLAPATDQRGVPRPIGFASDIGAFELEPRLTLALGPAGEVRLEYVFCPGHTNVISASSDLADWINLGTGVTDPEGRFVLEDPEAGQFPARFYRAENPR
jgi:uncharacterized delta-60 repeat protein